MKYEDLTIKQIDEIKDIKNKYPKIFDWKEKMHAKAQELGLTDSEILKANRS